MELEKIENSINSSICFSTQVDGSLDHSQSDNKFVCVQWIEADGALRTAFIRVVQPNEKGAKGLLETVSTSLDQGKLDRKKLVSVTTDGENANTGHRAGLWKLLEEYLNRKILTIWCSCHRSDLALEDLINSVPELRIWKSNVLDCSSFFRTSKNHTKELHDCVQLIGIKHLEFPCHHEVRFAEHLNVLLKAVIRNMPACRKVWSLIVDSRDSAKAAKLRASDLLNLWYPDSLQFLLTSFMCDITQIFTSLQKGLQKSHLILPDILTLRDAAVRKVEIVLTLPMPGGAEEFSLKGEKETNSTIRSHLPSLSASGNRSFKDIRSHIATVSKELIGKRLNVENERDIEIIKNVVTAATCSDLIKHSTDALKTFFIEDDEFDQQSDLCNREQINTLAIDICEQWPVIKEVPTLDTSDTGCQYSVRLRQMFQKSSGQFQFLLGSLLVSAPHNMGTERVMSHYNRVVSLHRRSASIETVSQRLIISINCRGTAYFDPRPAVVKFLTKKDRRFRPADFEL